MSSAYKAFAPATISNLGSGFDLLGLALSQPGDYVTSRPADHGEVRVTKITGFKEDISKTNNTAKAAVEALLTSLASTQGIDLEIDKGYAHSSGLGSSAASAVAAVVATNYVLGKPYKQKEALYHFALAGERSLNASLPADNVAASLLGGIVLSHPLHEPIILPVPQGLHVVIVRPHIRINTIENRSVLPVEVPLSSHTEQTYAMSNLILGLYRSDWDLLRRGLNDHIIEPVRSAYIPHFTELKDIANKEGAFGCSISGSGPSIFAICPNSFCADNISSQWATLLKGRNIAYDTYTSPIDQEGAHLC